MGHIKKAIESLINLKEIKIALTSYLYEMRYGKSEHDFQSPPKVQWFALCPAVLIENVSDAADGQQLQESLALEIIGFNYWQETCFNLACGASLIVNYSDRAGVEDVGWGAMFHIDNSYSFGITVHDFDDQNVGFFVTADLLKLFQDKKTSFRQYEDDYRHIQ